MTEATRAVADRLREAFEAGDLALLGPLLGPGVHWGGPEETEQTCHSPSDVLAWYGKAQKAGVRAEITEVMALDTAVVLALTVSGRGPNSVKRPDLVFQVFRLVGGLIVDIRGYPQRERALEAADMAEAATATDTRRRTRKGGQSTSC